MARHSKTALSSKTEALSASVIVAVCNEEEHIEACLSSLTKQTHSSVEIIVVDDGSTDATLSLAKSFESSGVQVLALPHGGKAIAVNTAAKQATGDVLFFLDGDMTFDEHYIERMLAPLYSGKVGSYHTQEYVINKDNVWSKCRQLDVGLPLNNILYGDEIDRVPEGPEFYRAIRREDFLNVGGFDNQGYSDDATLFPKIKETATWVPGAIAYHNNPGTLLEVFSTGKWRGRSAYAEVGWRVLYAQSPFWSLVRAVKRSLALRYLPLLPFILTRDLGIWVGAIQQMTSRKKSFGKL